MKTIIGVSLFLSLVSAPALSQESTLEPSFSIGLGMGSIYSGIGANLAYVSKHDMKYVSYGCTGISSGVRGSICGFGIGWIRTDLFNADTNKHGIGIYLSEVDEKFTFDRNNFENYDKENIYALGLNYTYFHNGINDSGFNAGISLQVDNGKGRNKTGGFFQIGYQF